MIRILSEIELLRSLIIHRPDQGIEHITPTQKDNLLYDDIVFLKQIQEEHDVFVNLLNATVGHDNVIDIENLLAEVLELEDVRHEIVSTICSFENCQNHLGTLLLLAPAQLANTLITGIIEEQHIILFQPIPNYIFCRDLAVIINTHILIGQASKLVRARESILSRYIFEYHSRFKGQKLIKLSSISQLKTAYFQGDNRLSVECGDVVMLGLNHLLVGCSERTTLAAFELIKDKVLSDGLVDSVVRVEMPKQRFCMHLDSIISVINYDECIVFEPLIMTDKLRVTQYFKNSESKSFLCLKDLIKEVSPGMEFILCGNGIKPFDEREQWTDACNVLAIKPGVAIMYDRNTRTLEALQQHGYSIVNARDITNFLLSKSCDFEDVSKTIIVIPSSELSRARGGSRCLSLPILRK
jgi:arginine deiminase